MSAKKKATSKIQDNNDNKDNTTIDPLTDKYKVALKFINMILANLGKPAITTLTEFTNIDREDIIKEVNKQSFDAMQGELFSYFDKVAMGWYRRNKVNNYILTFLRNMCDDLGLEFAYEQKDITRLIDEKSFRSTFMFYLIKKK